jgi:hypothetical protein
MTERGSSLRGQAKKALLAFGEVGVLGDHLVGKSGGADPDGRTLLDRRPAKAGLATTLQTIHDLLERAW